MNLLSFFSQQRRHWLGQAPTQPADYQAGGLTALALAEAAFHTLPLYNAQQQTAATQHELEEVSYQLSRAQQRIQALETSLQQAKSQLDAHAQQLLDIPKWHQRRAYKARKLLRNIAAATNSEVMRPETKLRKIQEVVNRFLASVQQEQPGQELEETEETGDWPED